MQTWNVGKENAPTKPTRELDSHEANLVAGGALPLVLIGVNAALGAGAGAASAHASGKNVVAHAVIGAVGGAVTGIGGAVWNASKVLSVTLMGAGSSLVVASTYGPGTERRMINYF